jgi:hypothetical protein
MIDIKSIKSSLELLEKNMVDEESKRTDLISSHAPSIQSYFSTKSDSLFILEKHGHQRASG